MIKCLVYDSRQNVNATSKSHRNVVAFDEWKFVSYIQKCVTVMWTILVFHIGPYWLSIFGQY